MNTPESSNYRASELKNSIWIINLLVLICGTAGAGKLLAAQSLLINEIMAANTHTLADEDGDFPDWIELFNAGQTALDLNNYVLSDDAANLLEWTLPEITLAPQAHFLIFASDKDRHSCIPYWQAVINLGDAWRYQIGTTEPPAGWYQKDFDDSGWAAGPSGFGYGDGDDNTIVPDGTLSVYIRNAFTIETPAAVTAMRLHVDYDDAFIAYLNGVEVARANITGTLPPFNQSADTYTEPKICFGGRPEVFTLDSQIGLLQNGTNVLAIQVHNSGSGSSDLTIIPFLSIGLTEQSAAPALPDTILGLSPVYPHANFKIKAEGEMLYLSDLQGQNEDSAYTDNLLADLSIGRYPDGNSTWLYYTEATPAAPNSSNGAEQIGGTVSFTLEAGFYSQAQTVRLTSSQPGSVIHYTLDGNEPDENSPVYTTPLQLDQTTVVRARCTGSGVVSAPIATNTYIIGRQPDLAVIALTTAPANLWDADSGIYVMGPNASSDLPYFGANFWQDWEKPVHVEFFEPAGVQGFELDAGLQIFGGWSRACAQKPLAIFARGKYGTSAIDYPIFPDLAIDKYEAFLLRNSANDWQYTMFRDAFMQSLMAGSAIDLQAYRPVVVYLNGAYWGILNLREKLNEHYIASHYDVDPVEIDLLESYNYPLAGNADLYNEFYSFIQNNDLSIDANYENVLTQMDIDNFIDYELAEIYFDNEDWPGNNIKYWRERNPNGRWRWMLFDTDFGFGLYDVNKYQNNTMELATATNGPGWPNPPWSTLILRKLLENEKFKMRFLNRAADFLSVNFDATRVNQQVSYFYNLLLKEMPYHFARWQTDLGWSGLSNWMYQISVLRTFANNRPEYFVKHLNRKFGLRGRAALTIYNTPAAGRVRLNRNYIESEKWTGHYFLDIPLEIEALPRPGYRFAAWSGSSSSIHNPLTIIPTGPLALTAVFVADSANRTIVINEINYHPATDFDPGEWVELLNNSGDQQNISGWIFKDSNDDNGFNIPDGTLLESGAFLVLCADTSRFRSCFPAVENVCGNFNFNLNNSGEFLRLYNQFGEMIDSVYYGDESPWPSSPDGSGPTLALNDPAKDNTDPANWSSGDGHGSPAAVNDLNGIEACASVMSPDCLLGATYPNPFNSSCLIPVKIDRPGQVEITVYNLKGARIGALYNGVLTPGRYYYRWVPEASLPSGIYFCRVSVPPGMTATRKMLLLK